jgi:tRNA modification GTPase
MIDFPDEDLPVTVADRLAQEIRELEREVRSHLDDGRRGERLREGLVFAVIGEPNVGKSSLINALAGRDVAIVDGRPGTTRDVIEARIALGGVPVTLLDTAGLRDAMDPVEAEGVRRARARATAADFVIHMVDASASIGRPNGAPFVLANKIDLACAPAWATHSVSVATGQGMAALREQLEARAGALTAANGTPPLTRARHRAALGQLASCLSRAVAAPLPELAGEELRLALSQLGSVTGAVAVEEILDAVFAQFCIGK